MKYRESTCYKCQRPVVFNIPYASREFKAYKCKCECGHEMFTFKPRDPERAKALEDAVNETREILKGER